MLNTEKHLYTCLKVLARELLDSVPDFDEKSRVLSNGFKLGFKVQERSGFTTTIAFTATDPHHETFTFIIQAYPSEFARVERLEQRGRVISESRVNGVYQPEILAKLNDSLSNYFDGICFGNARLIWELVA